jgi:hypothetical protein
LWHATFHFTLWTQISKTLPLPCIVHLCNCLLHRHFIFRNYHCLRFDDKITKKNPNVFSKNLVNYSRFLLSILNNRSMKLGSLFCLVVMRSTERGYASDHVLGVFGKLSTRRRGAWAWFHGVWTLWCKSSWTLNDFFTAN